MGHGAVALATAATCASACAYTTPECPNFARPTRPPMCPQIGGSECSGLAAALVAALARPAQTGSRSATEAAAAVRMELAAALARPAVAPQQRQPPQWKWSRLVPSLDLLRQAVAPQQRQPPQWERSWLLPCNRGSRRSGNGAGRCPRSATEAAAAVGTELAATVAAARMAAQTARQQLGSREAIARPI